MRKFLPFAVFGLIFSLALIFHAIFDNDGNTFAENVEKVSTKAINSVKFKKIEDLYSKAIWKNEVGDKITPSKLTSKIQIINFWASWCQPCLEEMPALLKLKSQFGDDQLQVVAINTDEEDQKKNVAKTMKRFGVKKEFINILDEKSQILDSFEITAIPVTIVYKNGKVLEYFNGPVDFQADEFKNKIQSWLKN